MSQRFEALRSLRRNASQSVMVSVVVSATSNSVRDLRSCSARLSGRIFLGHSSIALLAIGSASAYVSVS